MSDAPRTGTVHAARGTPRSRLESLFGPRIAESIRRAAGYRYPHTDLEEWPSTEVFRGEAEQRMASHLTQWLESRP